MNQEEIDDFYGWLCRCGHWQDDEWHCSECGNEPQWGCDCNLCHDKRLDEPQNPEFYGQEWEISD